MLTVGGRVMIVWGQGPYEKYHLLNFAVNLKPIKNLLAMQETQVQSLGWKDPLEKGKATHSSILENSMDCIVHGVTKSWTRLKEFHFHCN